MPEIQLTDRFKEFLESSVEATKHFARIMQLWIENNPAPPPMQPEPDGGPREWTEGEHHALTTHALTQVEIDKLVQGAAEQDMKDKFAAWVSGFLTGVTL